MYLPSTNPEFINRGCGVYSSIEIIDEMKMNTSRLKSYTWL